MNQSEVNVGTDLEVQSNSGAGHKCVEMLTVFFREDVLRECLIGIKRLLLYTTDMHTNISNNSVMYIIHDGVSHFWTLMSV